MRLYVSSAVPISRLHPRTMLLSPTVWVQSYPEYCRKIYNLKSEQFEKAIEALEKTQGRVCPGLLTCLQAVTKFRLPHGAGT